MVTKKSVAAVDLGGSNIRTAVVGQSGEISRRESVRIEKDGEKVLESLFDLIGSAIDESVIGIGVSVPGAVTPDDLVWAPNIPGWKDLPLKKILEEKFAPLKVTVKDDRASMVFGESRFGVAKGFGNVAYVIVGTGIGAGLMIDGRVYSGTRGLAGSIGWFVTGKTDGSRFHGDFEEEAAGPSLLRRMGVAGEKIMELAENGDPAALEAFYGLGGTLGRGIANLVSVVDPEIVVVGGGVSESWEFIEKGIRDSLRIWSHPVLKEIPVLRSSLGDNAGILGISRMVMEEVDG